MEVVSIIIPCYNYGWLLPETLDSVLAQTYPHWECIIIDDGSTDNSRAVGEEYQARDARFRYIYQENKGMSAARNHGIKVARGAYLQFLDSDDLIAPRKLEIQATYLTAHPEVDIMYGDVRYFMHGKPEVLSRSSDMQDNFWMAGPVGKGLPLVNILIEKNIMVVHSPLLRATLIEKVGLVSEELRSAEDWEYWVRCAIAGAHFHYDATPDAWALVRLHNTSTSYNVLRMHTYEMQARRNLNTLLQQIGAEDAIKTNEFLLGRGEATTAMHQLVRGSIWEGIKGFLVLGMKTGKYTYYFKSIPYWLKVRLSKSEN